MPTRFFPGSFDSLSSIASFVLAIAQEAGFDDFALYQIETGVDEACSNVIEHAYCMECEDDIEVTVESLEDRLVITIRDHGKPFDPKKIRTPNLKAKLTNRSDHGLGIYMMRQWMDEVEYFFVPGTNTLTLTKLKNPPS